MCLSRVTKIYKPILREVKRGWKVLLKSDVGETDKYYFEFFSLGGLEGEGFQSRPVELNKWLRATRVTIPIGLVGEYESGFHIFKTKKGAEKWGGHSDYLMPATVVPVEVRGVVYSGIQSGQPTWVAREMRVPDPAMKPRRKNASR